MMYDLITQDSVTLNELTKEFHSKMWCTGCNLHDIAHVYTEVSQPD